MTDARKLIALLPMLLIAFSTGCARSPRMGQYTYRVTLDESLRDSSTGVMPSIEIDFVGVNESAQQIWERQSIPAYFTPGNVLRTNATRHTLTFTNQRTEPQLLPADDMIWQRWMSSGARKMFIIASISMAGDPGAIDPRRLILPLDQARWNSKVIDIQINPSGVHRMTPMRPVK
ncbi:MAG: hypothetical protein O7G85_05940 [Planctomycetota bacterium]|nr:hypothetical protein [Planctomycetota bacterium]